jgi:hypothetical protein
MQFRAFTPNFPSAALYVCTTYVPFSLRSFTSKHISRTIAQSRSNSHSLTLLPLPRLTFPSLAPRTHTQTPTSYHKYHLTRRSSIAYTTPTRDPGSNVWCKVRGQLGSARLTAAIYSYMHSVPGAQRLWVRFCVLSFPFLLFPFSHFVSFPFLSSE